MNALFLAALILGCRPQEPIPTPAVAVQCPEATELQWGQRLDAVEHWCQAGGVMNGPYVRTFTEGKVAIRGGYRNNKPDGEWVWWSASGQMVARGRYQVGKMSDRWSWWHENGQLKQTGEFSDGRQSGSWPSWHDNGQKAEEGLYLNGAKDGVWGYWDRDAIEVRSEYWRQGTLLE